MSAIDTTSLPVRAGLGLKPEHYADILAGVPDVGFFEVHAENYMGLGGPPHRYLTAIRALYPLSLHGVGLSIGASRPLDKTHLGRLKNLVDRYDPQSFSEHLAWSTHDTGFLNDLLPLPYTQETLARVTEHVDQTQQTLGRRMLLENPSTYVLFAESTIDEIDFLDTVAERTGCGLLLDVNNVFVSARNLGFTLESYLDAYPLALVQEIHLAGHDAVREADGGTLLIDAHGSAVTEDVWSLYAAVVARRGALPTLIERDANVPALDVLLAEAARAEAIMARREAA